MRKANKILLTILVLMQPFLDTYFMYNEPSLEIFGFRFTTIIRYGFLAIIFILLLIETKFKKKRKLLVSYAIFTIIYIVFHHINALHFKSFIPGNFNYSLLEELFYIARYMFPFVLIYDIYHTELSKETFKKVLGAFSLIVSLSVIISNIFLISKSSYYEYTITYNIFDWFFKDISFANASTRGFFYATIVMTNLLLITPYIYYLYYKEGKYLYLTTIVCNMLALFMAGTRACTLGFVIIAVLMLFIYLFFTFIKKEIKLNIGHLGVTIFIIAFSFCLLPNSPAMQRVYLTNEIFKDSEQNLDNEKTSSSEDIEDNENTITSIEELESIDISMYESFEEIYNINNKKEREGAIKKYIYVNYDKIGINVRFFAKSYRYMYDYNFWADIIMNESTKNKADNRYIQIKIFDRIKAINKSKGDDLLGITYSRTSKIFNLERDFLYQYYSLGIIGVLLFLMPLVVLLLICMIRIVIKYKIYMTMENVCLCFGIALLLCVALYSGNMLDNLGITIVLGYVLGYLVKNVLEEKDGNNEIHTNHTNV